MEKIDKNMRNIEKNCENMREKFVGKCEKKNK